MLKKEIKIEEKKIFLGISVLFLLPTIYYILKGNKIINLSTNFSYFYLPSVAGTTIQKGISTAMFVGIMLALFFLYLQLIKKANYLFKTNRAVAGFIIAISIIFTCMLPMTSTDIFYYIGTGWSEAKYEVNPYYTSLEETMQKEEGAKEDEILLKTPKIWRKTTIVYGPVWPMICRVLSGLSAGSLTFALILYKLFNLSVHLINCLILYKLTKKRKWVLLYACNPLILFTGLTEVHNDILVVGMILLALYFFKKKKNMVITVILLAIATAIKYYAILLIPFLVIYDVRKQKMGKRILQATGWAILFIAIVAGLYLVYMKDIEVFKGIPTQQEKFANTCIVPLAVKEYKTAVKISRTIMGGYVLIYVVTILKLLFSKKISFIKNIRIYNNLLLVFIFLTITNFQAWYVMWLFSTIIWQRGKIIRLILNISVAVELANAVYFLLNESYLYASYYSLTFIILLILLEWINNKKGEKNAKRMQTRQIN